MLDIGLGPWRSRFVCCFIFLSSSFKCFPFSPSKTNLLGDFLMNRQNAATWYMFFFSFTMRIAY
jgi:hypothetical protein